MASFSLRTLACLCLILVATAASAGDEEPKEEATAPAAEDSREYELKYKFAAGEVLRTEIVHQAVVQTTIQGSSQSAETYSKSIKRWKIDNVDEKGHVTFTHMVDSIHMRQKSQGRAEVRYNSETDKEIPPGYEEAAAAVGVPLTVVTMDDRGTILKRKEQRPQPVSLSTQMTMPLPSHPVTIGDSWTTPLDIDVILKDGSTKKINTRQKFTLEKVADDVATVAVDTQVLTPINDPALEAQLVQRMSSGSVRFDMSAGRVLGQQLDLDRHVVGFSGPSSSMHYLTRFTEKLLPAGAVANKQSSPTATKQKPKVLRSAEGKKSTARKKTETETK